MSTGTTMIKPAEIVLAACRWHPLVKNIELTLALLIYDIEY